MAFLMVFATHAGLDNIVPGGFGVTVFFFLSGYLITTLLRIEREQHGRIHLRDFYFRRALRILPPFYFVLAIAIVLALCGVIDGDLEWAPLAAVSFHYGNFWIIRHGSAGLPQGTLVYWSLAVEEHFYLLFPWIFEGLHRLPISRPLRGAAVLAICTAILAWRIFLVLGHAPADRTYMGSDTRFDSLLFGCALAIGANPALDRSRIQDTTWRRVLLPLGCAGLAFAFLYGDPRIGETWRYTLQGIALAPVFVVAVRQPSWGPMKLLNWAPLRFLGVLSYPLYLSHVVILHVVLRHVRVPGPVAGVIALSASIALAWIIHRVIERPTTALRRRLSHGTVPAAPAG